MTCDSRIRRHTSTTSSQNEKNMDSREGKNSRNHQSTHGNSFHPWIEEGIANEDTRSMNCKEHHLPELELATGQAREALQAILYTILFIRSPGPVTPCDVECEGFNLTYPRIASDKMNMVPGVASTLDYDVDKKVDASISTFLLSLSQIGPELLSGGLTLSFFERRATRQLFGLVSNEEKVIWEQWHLRAVVNNTPRPVSDDKAAVIERQRIQDTAEAMLRSVLEKIFEAAGSSIDHVPPVMYEFEIDCSKKVDDRENVYSRVSNMPSLINLSN